MSRSKYGGYENPLAALISASPFRHIAGSGAVPAEQKQTFREPFTLKLRVDKDHYYEQDFDRVPYVADNDVYIFLDDHFGINLTDTKAEFLTVTFQPDTAKADVQFEFTQEKGRKIWSHITDGSK